MRILVTFALENEFSPWHAMRKFHPGKWGEADVYCAEVGFAEVGVVLTGAGREAGPFGSGESSGKRS